MRRTRSSLRGERRTAKQRNQKSHLFNFYAPTQYFHLCSAIERRPHGATMVANCVISPFDAITPLNPFVTADPDASPPPPPSSVTATSSAQTPTTAAAASASSPQSGSLQQLEAAAAAGGCNESSGRQLSPSSETGQDLSAPRQQSEVRVTTIVGYHYTVTILIG